MSRYQRDGGDPAAVQREPRVIESPEQTAEEVDRAMARRPGARRSFRRIVPHRFFPHRFPVPATLYGLLSVLGAALLIGVLFYSVREILSPFLLAVIAGILLYPFRTEPKLRPLLLATAVALFVWLIATAFEVFVPFILSFLLAYIVDPLVTMLQRKHFLPRWVMALIAALFLVSLIIVTAVYVMPVLVAQLGAALGSLGELSSSLVEWARNGGLARMTGISKGKAAFIVDHYVVPRIAGLEAMMLAQVDHMASQIPATIPSVIATVSNLLMVPFLTFYLVKDYWKIRSVMYSFVPPDYHVRSQHLLGDLHDVVGGFLRGDLITSIFQGLFIGVGLSLIGVEGAMLLGIITGILALIPVIGALIAYVLALVVALGSDNPASTAMWVTLLFGAQSIIESTVIGPQVMGRHTELHPVLIMISLLLFGYFMGVLGMLLAIPVTGLLVRWAWRWRDRRRAQIEREKVAADIEANPHHASRGNPAVAGVTAGPKGRLP